VICTICPATLIVAARLAPVLGSTVKLTVPPPWPVAPPVIRTQVAEAPAVHAHSEGALTATELLPPCVSKLREDGETEYVQLAAPESCEIVKLCPPAVTVPLREAPALAATEYPILPVPVPLVAPVTPIHDAVAVAVQAHPAGAVMVNVPLPPLAPIDRLDGDKEYVHAATGALAWLTAKVCPAMVSVPLRWDPALAATAMATVPLPEPLASPVIEIQESLLDAVQEHAAGAPTATCTLAAPAATDALWGVSE
jgi:hypothetical protein